MAGKFALITHPYDLPHLRRILDFFRPGGRLPSDAFLLKVFDWTPPLKLYEWEGLRSPTGVSVDGYNISCTIMPEMPHLGPKAIFEKVRAACQLAGELGANVAALGGFTSIYGENGHGSAIDTAPIAVTTGNSLTTAMALEGIRRACEALGVELSRATVAIVGATGDIGTGCARVLAREAGRLNLAARGRGKLEALAESLDGSAPSDQVRIMTDNREALAGAHVVLGVASASAPILEPEDFAPGAIVCDVGYPKNVAARTAERPDVFVFDGGLVETPSEIDFGFDNGLPSTRVLYGCFAEAIVLAMEGRYESFSRGKGHITPDRVAEIAAMGQRHGVRLAPFYSGGRLVSDAELADRRERLPRRP